MLSECMRRWWLIPLIVVAGAGCMVVQMRPRTEVDTPADAAVRAHVEAHVRALGGPRNVLFPEAYAAATAYVEGQLEGLGYDVTRERVGMADNVAAELPGGPGIVLLGAHYDSCGDAPGADDNASGVAAMLEVARLLAGRRLAHTVRFVAWANEEPPFFQRDGMGSRAAAAHTRARGDDLVAVLALDSVGYYDDAPGSQQWPMGLGALFPNRADFINVVSRTSSGAQVVRVASALRRHSSVPVAAGAVPAFVTGVDWSDHWSYWQEGYDAVMITDMPPFRNPNYHERTDTPDTLDYDRLARLTVGLAGAIEELAGE